MKRLGIILFLTVTLLSCNNLQDKNKKIISSFFQELTENNLDKVELYNKYFFIADLNQEGRSDDAIKNYEDTIFFDLHQKFKNKQIEISTLKEALSKYPTANLYRNYYDGQDKEIYICNVDLKPVRDNVIYILMY